MGCTRAVHAEKNAIRRAWEKFYPLSVKYEDDLTLYCTHAPCADCAISIREAGIDRIFFQEHYRDPLGVSLLRQAEVEVYRMTPNGWIIDEEGKLVDIHSLD